MTIDGLVLNPPQLPKVYNEVLNHPNTSDELRRETESKLFRQRQRYLYALPQGKNGDDKKSVVAEEVDRLAEGMVLLGIPDELAWLVVIESKDVDTISE